MIHTDSDWGIAHRSLEIGHRSVWLKVMAQEMLFQVFVINMSAEGTDRLPRILVSTYSIKRPEEGLTCDKLEWLGHELVFVVRHVGEC